MSEAPYPKPETKDLDANAEKLKEILNKFKDKEIIELVELASSMNSELRILRIKNWSAQTKYFTYKDYFDRAVMFIKEPAIIEKSIVKEKKDKKK